MDISSELNQLNYSEMQGAKYSLALPLFVEGGHYLVHACNVQVC